MIFKFYSNQLVEWNGPWSDNSKEWTTGLLKELNGKFTNSNDIYKFKDDGCFFMCFADFCDIWRNLSPIRAFQYEKGMFHG
jgi:hypothetical protein